MNKEKIKKIAYAILIVVGILLLTAGAFVAVVLKQIDALPH